MDLHRKLAELYFRPGAEWYIRGSASHTKRPLHGDRYVENPGQPLTRQQWLDFVRPDRDRPKRGNSLIVVARAGVNKVGLSRSPISVEYDLPELADPFLSVAEKYLSMRTGNGCHIMVARPDPGEVSDLRSRITEAKYDTGLPARPKEPTPEEGARRRAREIKSVKRGRLNPWFLEIPNSYFMAPNSITCVFDKDEGHDELVRQQGPRGQCLNPEGHDWRVREFYGPEIKPGEEDLFPDLSKPIAPFSAVRDLV